MVGEYRGQGLFVETKQTLFYRWRALRLVCLVKSIVCCFFVFLWTLVYELNWEIRTFRAVWLRNDHSPRRQKTLSRNEHLTLSWETIASLSQSPPPWCLSHTLTHHHIFTQKSIWFNVNNYHRVLFMFGIIWNVSVWLVQMPHSQRSKPKGNNVFKSLENLHTEDVSSRQMAFYSQKVYSLNANSHC